MFQTLKSLKNKIFDEICTNFMVPDAVANFKIGYAHTSLPFIIFPSLALMLNLFIIITHIRKYIKQ